MMMKNVGPSDDLMKEILTAVYLGSLAFLVLDQARTVRVCDIKLPGELPIKELVVECEDIEDGITVFLHLPYAPGSAASALILRPKMEGE